MYNPSGKSNLGNDDSDSEIFNESDDLEVLYDSADSVEVDDRNLRKNYVKSKAFQKCSTSKNTPFKDQTEFKNLYVKNFGTTLNSSQLYDSFRRFGQILSAKVATNENGESLGFGFVSFDNHESASAAVQKMNGFTLNGCKLYVAEHKKKDERIKEIYAGICSKGCNVFIKNLHASIDDKELEELCEDFGNITSAKVEVDPITQQSKMYGYVCFKTSEEASKAITGLNHCEYKNKRLSACLFVPDRIRKEIRRLKSCNSNTCNKDYFQKSDYAKRGESKTPNAFPQYQFTHKYNNSRSLNNTHHYPQQSTKETMYSERNVNTFQSVPYGKLSKQNMVAPFATSLLCDGRRAATNFQNSAGKRNVKYLEQSIKKERLPLAAKFNSAVTLSPSHSSNGTESSVQKKPTTSVSNSDKREHDKYKKKYISSSALNLQNDHVNKNSFSKNGNTFPVSNDRDSLQVSSEDLYKKETSSYANVSIPATSLKSCLKQTKKKAYLCGSNVNVKEHYMKPKDGFP